MSVRGRTTRTPCPRTELSDVMRDDAGAFRRPIAAEFARVHGRARRLVDLQRNSTEGLLEERCGLGRLAARFRRSSATPASGRTKREEATCRAPRIAWLPPVRDSNSAISHPNPSKTAFALGADAPFQQQAGTTSRCGLSSTLHRGRPTMKGSLHRDDAGRLGVPRPRTWIVIVVAYRESKYPDDTGLAYPTARSADSGESRGKMVSPVVDPACRFSRAARVDERRTADRKSAGASDALEAPVIVGGPSRTLTLDPLIKSQLLYQLS